MIAPDAFDGAFQGTFRARIVGGLASGTAVAFGTGDLEGLQLSGTIDDFLSDAPGGCDDELGRPFPWKQTLAKGRILEPNRK